MVYEVFNVILMNDFLNLFTANLVSRIIHISSTIEKWLNSLNRVRLKEHFCTQFVFQTNKTWNLEQILRQRHYRMKL